jgi:hypothetical protein
MSAPRCVACRLPVIELRGQHDVLAAYVVQAGTAPLDSAGSWHTGCLTASPAGELWHLALRHSYLDVRGYRLLADTENWTVVQNPNTGEVLALGRQGSTLGLSGIPGLRATPSGDGTGYRARVYEYNLEPGDEQLTTRIQQQLRDAGRYPVLDLAEAWGIRERLSHPEVLADAAFRLDPEVEPEWTTRSVIAAVEHGVFVPAELTRYLQLHPLL